MTDIAVVIPVGPEQHHARWLNDCLRTVVRQTRQPDRVVLVDDMHRLPDAWADGEISRLPITVHRPVWRLGVAHAFNHGSAVAFQQGADLALMLGADDLLEPKVLQALDDTYRENEGREGYYWFEVMYSHTGETQRLPCNCAAWTPGLFRETGGFPIESASGQCDAAYISRLIKNKPRSTQVYVPGVPDGRFIHRVHEFQETRVMASLSKELIAIRNLLTENYEDTQWGRYW